MVVTLVWSLLVCILWWVGTGYALPSPLEILHSWVDLFRNGGLLYELLFVSFRLNLEVVFLSTFISLTLAYAAVERNLQFPAKVLASLRFLGMSGFVIVLQRFFGGGHALKVAMLTFIMTTFMTTSMLDVVQSVLPQEYNHAKTLGMSRLRAIYEVVILGKRDLAFDALIQNAAIGWMSLTMVEGLVKFEGGIGLMMINEAKYRNLAPIFALQLTTLLVGLGQDVVLKWLKGVCCPYIKFRRVTHPPQGSLWGFRSGGSK